MSRFKLISTKQSQIEDRFGFLPTPSEMKILKTLAQAPSPLTYEEITEITGISRQSCDNYVRNINKKYLMIERSYTDKNEGRGRKNVFFSLIVDLGDIQW